MTVEATTATIGRGAGLRPAPRSRALSIVAVVVGLAVLLLVGTYGQSVMTSSVPGSAVFIIGFLASTGGVLWAAIILWVAVRGLGSSLRSAREEAAGDVLASRSSASQSRQRSLITFGMALSLLACLSIVTLLTMNDGAVQKTFFNGAVMAASFWNIVLAFGVNIQIALISIVLILIFGLILAIARMVPGRAGRPIRALAIAYIDVFRAIPAIVVLYLVGFGLPLAKIPILSGLSPVGFAVVALTLTYSAYAAETYRAGIEMIHPSQSAAARSLGFSYGQSLRYAILPQAIRGVIPPLMSMFVGLQKDTSLVNIIGTVDAFNQAKFYSSAAFNLSPVTVVAAIFVIVTIPQTRVVDWALEAAKKKRSGR